MKHAVRLAILMAAVMVGHPGGLFAKDVEEVVRLHGATTTVNGFITPYRAAVERATGLKLEITGNATGRGLVDLVEGRCDVALTSEPLEIAVLAAKNAGKDLQADAFEMQIVTHDEIVFIVHPSNPVRELSWAQIKDIHTGRIKNWNEVGGPTMRIIVFTDAITGGTRAMIKKIVLGGEDYGPDCRPLEAVRFVNDQVAELKGGFGGLGRGFVDTKRVKIVTTEKLERPLGFITKKGDVSANARKVMEAFQAEVAKAK